MGLILATAIDSVGRGHITCCDITDSFPNPLGRKRSYVEVSL